MAALKLSINRKWEYKVKSAAGKDSVVHYVRDPQTGETMDFKFKKHSTDF
jgi:filamentous hemagglutinin